MMIRYLMVLAWLLSIGWAQSLVFKDVADNQLLNFVHDHGGANALTTAMVDRINDSAGVWNSSGAQVDLNEVFSDATADMHVHGDSTSGCGTGALGCAESNFFTAHTPSTYGDGDAHHQMASQQVAGGVQEMTMYTRSDWYTGAAAGGIGGSEYDYMTVAIQEFGHHLGLAHNSGTSGHSGSASSPMNGSLANGITRRVLQSEDLTAIQHVWGASAVPEPTSLILFGIPMVAFIGSRKRRS